MAQISGLIIQRVETLVEAEDHDPLQFKRKAISALLLYAVWQERDGRPEMLATILTLPEPQGCGDSCGTT